MQYENSPVSVSEYPLSFILFHSFSRNGIKKVIQLLVQLRSVDKARLVAKEHNMEEQVKDI